MENIKIGYIGLGCRGKDLLENIVLAQKEQVVAVCDVYEDRAREGAKVVEAAGQSMLMKKLKHRSCSWKTAASAAAN